MQTADTEIWQNGPFRLEPGIDLTPVRQALIDAGYTQSALAAIAKRRYRTEPLDITVIQRRIVSPTPLHTLIRLFLLRHTVSMEVAATALTSQGVERLLAVGLLLQLDTGVRAEAMLFPYDDDLFVVHDFPVDILGAPLEAQHVLGVGGTSNALASLTVRRQHEAVLDVGTGSGIQALLAARHAAQVIATDLNPRALNFVTLNARLNGLSNITLRHGSMYEPVGDAQFDLVVANPPFVISPESRYLYRDSVLPGDAISEQVIRGIPARLREGGYGIVLCNWYHRQGQEWFERLRQWVEGGGCDAWLVCFETDDPLSYAANWLRPSEGHDLQRYEQLLDTWLQYYERLGIAWVNSGVVILRRHSGHANWIRADIVPYRHMTGCCSSQIQRIFAAQDVLESLERPEQLLDCRLVLTPEHQLQHLLKTDDGHWTITEALLKQTEGLEFTGQVDRLVSTVLAGCNGRHSLRALATEVARGLDLEFAPVALACLGVIQQLMRTGFLSVTDASP